jgi:hypothetical protein
MVDLMNAIVCAVRKTTGVEPARPERMVPLSRVTR